MNGHRIDAMSESELMAVRADVGMVFQEGALFDYERSRASRDPYVRAFLS